MTPLRRAPRLRAHAGVSFVEREYLLAEAGRGDGRWNGGQLEMAQDAGDDRLLGNGGNDAKRATVTKWAGRHIQIKHTAEQLCPFPIRCRRLHLITVDALLARIDRPSSSGLI
jgi:hypothetical protein